jgi:hypothetical protein
VPDFEFLVESVQAGSLLAQPAMVARLEVKIRPAELLIHTLALRYQALIEAPRRRYSPTEQVALFDLFGPPNQWHRSLRSIPWHRGSCQLEEFVGQTNAELLIPCETDPQSAVNKYFRALEEGEVSLTMLFSGAAFCAAADRPYNRVPIPWDKQATFRLPVSLWREAMENVTAAVQ